MNRRFNEQQDTDTMEQLRQTVEVKQTKQFIIQPPKHQKESARQVKYNMPIFTNFDGVIKAKPTHKELTKSQVEKAETVQALYEQKAGRGTVEQYLQKNAPSYKIVELLKKEGIFPTCRSVMS